MYKNFKISEQERLEIQKQHLDSKKIKINSFKKLVETKSGEKSIISEQEQKMQELVNNIANEGIKNVTPEMIAAEPFDVIFSGDGFGGEFNGINYRWIAKGVEGMDTIRGIIYGKLICEKNSELSKSIPSKDFSDADPNGVCVGFYSRMKKFVIYMTKDKKPKCVSFE